MKLFKNIKKKSATPSEVTIEGTITAAQNFAASAKKYSDCSQQFANEENLTSSQENTEIEKCEPSTNDDKSLLAAQKYGEHIINPFTRKKSLLSAQKYNIHKSEETEEDKEL